MPAVKPRERTRPRVASSQPKKLRAGKKQMAKPETEFARPEGFIHVSNNELFIAAQLAETVPVGPFANVVIGPVQLMWKLGSVDMESLMDIDWSEIEDSDDFAKLPAKQRDTVQRVRQGLRSTMMLIEFTIAEDRDTVERSVQQFMERQEAEAADKKKRS